MWLFQSPRIFCLTTLLHIALAYNLDCEQVPAQGKIFDLSSLGGPKTVTTTEDQDNVAYLEIAFTIDVCKFLVKPKLKEEKNCPAGSTRVCAISKLFNPIEHIVNATEAVYPIAGDFSHTGGGSGPFDPKATRLSTSTTPGDRDKEGVRIEMGGGYRTDRKIPQKAVVEFLCKREDGGEKEEQRRSLLARDDDDEDNGKEDDDKDGEREKKKQTDDGNGGTLQFISYEPVDKSEVLTLEWRTKYACEDHTKGDGESSSGHWGFFTWFIIIIFLAVAAYLIFGSWLNYNRYSARGWDLVPHSETLRDIPYIFKDWMRRVVNTLQGGGSRGGYSAV